MNDMDQFIVSPDHSPPSDFHSPIKLAVMASGRGSNLNAIIQSIKSKKLSAEIILVVVNKKCGAMDIAAHNNIPVKYYQNNKYTNREDLDNLLSDQFIKHNIDIIVMAGWMRIVTPILIDSFPNQIVNIHPSILPSFKGIDAIQQAINCGVKVTGCTVHLVTKEVDSGPILIQSAVPVHLSDNLESLHKRVQEQEHKILPLGIAIAAEKLRKSGKIKDKLDTMANRFLH